ncbi:hypothetical protein WJX75_006146 [Coccomyxa subellipsoidea]|uniref:Acyltransferase n=1 Tax=Coccomyxa subellipsoidea TaxID=248742 RepID=A0ABR2YE45_9CHLO
MGEGTRWLELLKAYFAISMWVGALFATVLSLIVAIWNLPDPFAVTWLALMGLSLAVPLDLPTPRWARALTRFSLEQAAKYHDLSLIIEDPAALRPGRPYVVGYEPHSALPTALPMVFCEHSPIVPPALKSVKTLATSACFYCPVVRHLWWWLGGRPASAAEMRGMLSKGDSALVCPGGVRECLYMEKGREAVFLSGRTGFVRIAMQYGAPLVPVFVFGQTDAYGWMKLGPRAVPQELAERLARAIGFLPLFMYGVWGTPLPRKVKITMVVGKPIELPKVEHPSSKEVDKYLETFKQELSALFERHKAAAGYPKLQLLII